MAKRLSSVDFNNIAVKKLVLEALSELPQDAVLGRTYVDSSTKMFLYHDGTDFVDPRARQRHTGTQNADTIADFDFQVRTNRLDQMAAPTSVVSFNNQNIDDVNNITATGTTSLNSATIDILTMSTVLSMGNAILELGDQGLNANGNSITNLSAPVSANDAARLVDVQSAAAGIDSKPSVRFVSTGSNINIAAGGLIPIDGGTSVVAGDRVLLKDQTIPAQNGVYVAAVGAWSRATDADETGEITPGAFWFVEEGDTQAATQWRCSNTGTVTLGTTPITIVQFGASAMYSASNGVLLTGNNFTGVVETDGGLNVGASGFSVKNDINSSIELTASGVGIRLKTNGGLSHNGTNGMLVKVASSNGTGSDANGINVTHHSSGGTYNTASGVSIKLNGNSGLALSSGGINVVGTNGITVTGSGVAISLAGSSGLSNTGALSLLADPNGGIQTSVAGTSVKLPANSGLVADATGLYVDTTKVARKATFAIGDGTTTTFALTHNLGTRYICVTILDSVLYSVVDAEWVATDNNTVTVTFATPPLLGNLRVVVVG